MIPKSFRPVEPGIFVDNHLGLTIQVAQPSIWVFGSPEKLLGMDADGNIRAALQRAAAFATRERKARQRAERRRRLVPA